MQTTNRTLQPLALVAPMLLYAVLRLPALLHQPGMQDEQWFAVPGYTVWQEGIPRIPYVPTRNRGTLFENADVCLMALPPGLFYVQAPCFGLFPAGYPTARLPLFLAALLTIGITFWVVRRLGGNVGVASAAAVIMALSRPLLFTGLTVRPDLLAAVAGWLAVITAWQMVRRRYASRSAMGLAALGCGALSGLAGLFHPFALVFAIQCGLIVVCCSLGWAAKIQNAAIYVVGNLIVLAAWLPLILSFPYEFKSQFFANVLNRAGPGLTSRMIWPFPSIVHHARLLYEFAGPFQCGLMLFHLVAGSVMFYRYSSLPRSEKFLLLAIGFSSVYLTATVAGIHPTKGYWIYPFLWLLAIGAVGFDEWIKRFEKPRAGIVAFAVAVLLMLPGAGLRTTWVYLTHWKQVEYYAPKFASEFLDDLPRDGVFYADLSYVFNVFLSGRETRLAQERELYWGDQPLDYKCLILSWEGRDAGWAEQYDGRFARQVGADSIPQQCFVDLYRPPEKQPDVSDDRRTGKAKTP